MAQGDSRITATAAQAISIDVQFDFYGLTFAVLAILTGISSSTSGAGGTLENYMNWGNFRFPYWGIIGQAWAAENVGDTLVFLPKCKVMSGLSWRLEFGKIVAPSFKGTAIYDDYTQTMIEIIERATANQPVVIPPT